MPLAQAMSPSGKRLVVISYAGRDLKMEVRDPHTEWELRPSVRTQTRFRYVVDWALAPHVKTNYAYYCLLFGCLVSTSFKQACSIHIFRPQPYIM